MRLVAGLLASLRLSAAANFRVYVGDSLEPMEVPRVVLSTPVSEVLTLHSQNRGIRKVNGTHVSIPYERDGVFHGVQVQRDYHEDGPAALKYAMFGGLLAQNIKSLGFPAELNLETDPQVILEGPDKGYSYNRIVGGRVMSWLHPEDNDGLPTSKAEDWLVWARTERAKQAKTVTNEATGETLLDVARRNSSERLRLSALSEVVTRVGQQMVDSAIDHGLMEELRAYLNTKARDSSMEQEVAKRKQNLLTALEAKMSVFPV